MLKSNVKRFFSMVFVLASTASLLAVCQVSAETSPSRHQALYQVDYTPMSFGSLAGSGQPLIPVILNGTQTAAFLFDTGTSYSVISTELAKKMNLPLKPGVSSVDGLPIMWKGKQATMTTLSVLSVGTLRFTNMPVIVLSEQAISLSPSGHGDNPFQGILGSSILQQFAILLDCQKHKFGVCLPGNLSDKQLVSLDMSHPYVLPLTNSNTFQWFVQAQLINSGYKDNQSLLLDTGSDRTYISAQAAQTVKMKTLGQQENRNAYGFNTFDTSQIEKFQLGDLTLSDFPVAVRPILAEEPQLLGMDILSNYRVLMDFPAKKMYLQPNAPAAVPTITIGPTPAATTPLPK